MNDNNQQPASNTPPKKKWNDVLLTKIHAHNESLSPSMRYDDKVMRAYIASIEEGALRRIEEQKKKEFAKINESVQGTFDSGKIDNFFLQLKGLEKTFSTLLEKKKKNITRREEINKDPDYLEATGKEKTSFDDELKKIEKSNSAIDRALKEAESKRNLKAKFGL